MTPPAEAAKKTGTVVVIADDDVDTLNIVKVKLEAVGNKPKDKQDRTA